MFYMNLSLQVTIANKQSNNKGMKLTTNAFLKKTTIFVKIIRWKNSSRKLIVKYLKMTAKEQNKR